ncbi:MAG: hypothetical protein FWC50_14010 [Planctomycetaceae bacterium]|nr:hypothetical protein [Planctomycetaceae bacterium]
MLVQCNQCEHFFFDDEDPDSGYRMEFDQNDNDEMCPHCGEPGCLQDVLEDHFVFEKHFGLGIIRSAILNRDEPTFTVRASDPRGQAAMAAYWKDAEAVTSPESRYWREAERIRNDFASWAKTHPDQVRVPV